MVCNELNSRMPLQQKIIFYVPLESTCCLFAGYWHEFPSRESYDKFVLPVLEVSLEVVILCKKLWHARGPGTVNL